MNKIDTQNPYSDSSEEDLVVNSTNKNYHNPTQKRQWEEEGKISLVNQNHNHGLNQFSVITPRKL